jgi:hypothetical protein
LPLEHKHEHGSEIKSRFHSKRNATSRNLELEGTLRRAEESVLSAMNLKQSNGRSDENNSNMNTSISMDRYRSERSGQKKTPSMNRSSDSRTNSVITSSLRKGGNNSMLSPSPSSSTLEYTVQFEAGSIGLKVEPVIKNGDKEFGCRVMKFVDCASPSQAIKSGRIAVGHVMTAVNGRNVTSKSYADIVALLAEHKSEAKGITFRVPRPQSSMSNISSSTPSVSFRLPSFDTPKEELASPNQNSIHHIHSPAPSATPPTMFSPSFVKKLSRTSLSDQPVFNSPSKQPVKSVTDVLNNVIKNMVPEAHETMPAFATGALSKRISKALTGSYSTQFDEAVQMKMELLTELSEAKASLGEHEMNIKKMEEIVDTLAKEKDAIKVEKEVAESTLTDIQMAKVRSIKLYKLNDYIFSCLYF